MFWENPPSNQAVYPESYSTKLSSYVKKRIMMEVQDEVTYCFKPTISAKCCLCGVNLDFIFSSTNILQFLHNERFLSSFSLTKDQLWVPEKGTVSLISDFIIF